MHVLLFMETVAGPCEPFTSSSALVGGTLLDSLPNGRYATNHMENVTAYCH